MLFYQEVQEVCKNIDNIKKTKKIKIINKFKKKWIEIMALSNLFNKKFQTFSLNYIEITDYGFKSDIYIVPPLTFDKLDNYRNMIEENMNCLLTFEHKKSSVWINCKFIYNQNKDRIFKPINQPSPYKLYICNDFSGEPVFADMRKYSHILISGTTRSGKSKLTDCLLTNLVYNCDPKDVNLYLCQVAKYDLCLYEDLEHTKAFADTLDKTLTIMKYIVETEMPNRANIIKPYRQKAILDNMYEYNELKTTKEKYPMILVVFDEMASLFDKKGNSNAVKNVKEQIESYIQSITQYGASLSVYILSSIQRPTANLLPPFIKAMSNTLISLKQANSKSSEVATDDSKLAVGLPQRQLVYNLDEWNYGIVPLVNTKDIYQYIKPNIKPNHKTLFDEIKSEDSQYIKKSKVKIQNEYDYSKLDYNIQQNINKIKGYVPYQDYKGLTVIDKTNLSSKTNKPKGRVKL